MYRLLGSYEGALFALLRIVAGFLFFSHGIQKLFGALGGFPPGQGRAVDLFSKYGLAGIIETVSGLLILVGLFGSLAAFIASGEMAVAYFTVHQPRGGLPIQNGGELAVLFCFIFLYIAARGSGRFSLAEGMGRPDLA